jgi:hypothetical protein
MTTNVLTWKSEPTYDFLVIAPKAHCFRFWESTRSDDAAGWRIENDRDEGEREDGVGTLLMNSVASLDRDAS